MIKINSTYYKQYNDQEPPNLIFKKSVGEFKSN